MKPNSSRNQDGKSSQTEKRKENAKSKRWAALHLCSGHPQRKTWLNRLETAGPVRK